MAFCFAGNPSNILQLRSNIGPISVQSRGNHDGITRVSRWYHEGILDHTRSHPVLSCLGDAKDSTST